MVRNVHARALNPAPKKIIHKVWDLLNFEDMNINIRSLMPQFFKLSKSTIIKGMQCERYLYLLKHKPKERTPHDAATLLRFAQGKDFEARYKATFANGTDVAAMLQKDVWSIGAAYTAAAIAEGKDQTLFEACFNHNDTLIMADICQVKANGDIDIYEVKNGTEVKDVFLRDMAIQYYVIKNAARGLQKFHLVLNDGLGGFLVKDMTSELEERSLDDVKTLIPTLLATLQLPSAPEVPMGERCHFPYECEYIAYCKKCMTF